ncbi:hypothetical protein [Effusibacillus consociatus]|uniref:Uncharacterized protein n=1 Tax=Effusibacillus consociatus TaxID=1117041 RepID=A0ABV9Q341_9BACL
MPEERPKEQYPAAMLNFGIPAEMSPIEDITNVTDAPPMLEISRPLNVGEPWEISKPIAMDEIAEERQDLL